MKSVFGKATLCLVATLLLVAIALGQGRGQRGGGSETPAPAASPGAAILARACGGCHAADVISNYNYESAEGYRDVVNTMIGAGAVVTPQELPVLVDYLFATYGKKPPAGATPAVADDPGKALITSACTTCHGLDSMVNHAYDSKEPYEALIHSMIGFGANVTDAQIPVLAEYMFKTYGKKPAATAAAPVAVIAAENDPGKAILEKACTSCHGLDGMKNHNYPDKAAYESLARSMVTFGAVVTDAQMPALVDYMFKTYGKK